MSVIGELLKMDPACMPGGGHEFEHNLLIQECFGELSERVKALENHLGKMDSVQTDILMTIQPPAPDLEAIIDKYILWVNTNPRDALRAFAATLGFK